MFNLCCGRKDEIEELVDLEKAQFWDGSVSSKTIRLWASGGALKKMGQLIVLDQKSIFCNWPFRVDLGPKSGSVRTRFREFPLEMMCDKLRYRVPGDPNSQTSKDGFLIQNDGLGHPKN